MSQFGMQLPGSQRTRRSGPNAYSALLFLAVVCLGAACAYVWIEATKLSPGSGFAAPFSLQNSNDIRLPQ